MPGFVLACPVCQGAMRAVDDVATCDNCAQWYPRWDGIWRCLPEDRAEAFVPFVLRYGAVRAREGWGGADPAYYRALPATRPGDPQHPIWRQRARAFQVFVARVLTPAERASPGSLRILDLGAGNCWLAYQLARRGHRVAAIDLSDSRTDGLGARTWYDRDLLTIQAEFDRLPFVGSQFDLVIFNASLHYAADCAVTLREALRVLAPSGQVVILDSPLYRNARNGEAMVQAREARFRADYGFSTRPLASEGYLADGRLAELGRELGLAWRIVTPGFALRRSLHAWRSWLRGRREPAAFPVVVGTRTEVATLPRWRSPDLSGSQLARCLIWWRFRLFQRHRHDRLVLEDVLGYAILVLPGVFNPKLFRTGEYLAATLDAALVPPGARVLDLGTGSGIGAVAASTWAREVIAVDLNPAAVRCARINAILNRRDERIIPRAGDLFAPVAGERFDVVLFNPPFFRGEPRDAADLAWHATDVVERFTAGLTNHLTSGGYALVVFSSDGDTPGLRRAALTSGLAVDVVAVRRFLTETLTVYRLRPRRVDP